MPPEAPSQNERQFVRVDDQLPMAWRRISENDLAEIMQHYERYRSFPKKSEGIHSLISSLDIGEKLRQLERTDPMLARILGQLDIKLNILLRLFHPDENSQPFTPTPVNLSGGGLAFWEKAPPIAPGDILSIRIALTQDSLAAIECYARVIRILPGDRAGMDKVACKFEPILDADREKIIQHIFRRQSEILRSQRT